MEVYSNQNSRKQESTDSKVLVVSSDKGEHKVLESVINDILKSNKNLQLATGGQN